MLRSATTRQPAFPTRHGPLIALGLGFFVVLADTTAMNVALPEMGRYFRVGVATLQWTLTAYTITFAGLLLTGGALGDRFGARKLFLTGVALFAGGAVVCLMAPTFGALLAARVLQGAGAALLLPNSLSLLTHTYPEPGARASAIAGWSGVAAVGLTAGPVMGGFLVELAGWRAVFGFNAGVSVLAFGLTAAWLVESPPGGQRSLDLAGQLAAALALAAATFALVQAKAWGLDDGRVLTALVAAVAAALVFFRVETHTKEPAIPLELFRAASFSAPVIIGFLFNFAFYGTPFVLSLHLQNNLAVNPGAVGLLFLPMSVADAIMAFNGGRLARRFGPRTMIVCGMVAGALGVVVAMLFPDRFGTAAGYMLVGAGGGALIPPLTACLLSGVPSNRAGIASGILNAARQAGGALGIAILGMIVGGFAAGLATTIALATIAAVFAGTAIVARFGISQSALDRDAAAA